MTEQKTINCAECNVEFTFEENPKYPRKYCLNCSAKKKKEWGGNGDQKYSKAGYTPSNTGGYGAPVEKITGEIRTKSNGKEYHLSPEQVRSNALSSAINWLTDANMDGLLATAKEFEEWINGQS